MDFAELFKEHARFVWRALVHLGVRERDADDLCQEVFLIVHRKLAGFEGRSSLRTWIYGITARVASDYKRSARVRREELVAAPHESPAPADPHQDAERRQTLDRLERALGALDQDKRAVFVLYEIEQLTMAEVAAALECPLQTAYSRLHAARKTIGAAFAEPKELR